MTEDGQSRGDEAAPGNHLNRLIEDVYCARIRIFVLKYFLKFFNNLLGQLGPLSVLLVGGWMVIQGQTEVGTIVAFISGFERLTGPSRELLNYYRRLSQMRVQYRLVAETV
jgi:ABC-type bacteriocin/lantibiotic exporter with double-glycine peptidase domain